MRFQHVKQRLASLAGVIVIGLLATLVLTGGSNLHENSVMIVNRAKTSGGTGIILNSSSTKSEILTNTHVCRVVAEGGYIITPSSEYQVNSVKPSAISDLCLITVLHNLGVKTKIARYAPKMYDKVLVNGHPALMPNIISEGHLSGTQVISVVSEMRACTPEDMKGSNAIICAFLGGVPVVKDFESSLTSATIMPGSSGSGVYNRARELIGVVFAGSSEFGYSWIVPYAQVLNFLNKESKDLPEVQVKQELKLSVVGNKTDASLKQARKKCLELKLQGSKALKEVCDLLSYSMLWEK